MRSGRGNSRARRCGMAALRRSWAFQQLADSRACAGGRPVLILPRTLVRRRVYRSTSPINRIPGAIHWERLRFPATRLDSIRKQELQVLEREALSEALFAQDL